MTNEKFIPALGYDFLTAYYDWAIKLTMPEKKFRDLLVEEVNPTAGEKILEFGFGTGQNLLLVKANCPETNLFGLDIDPKVKAITEHKLSRRGLFLPLDLYNGGDFPYTTSKFDKVYSCLVFHQLDAETKLACLREIHRVLKRGGKLVIADWGKADGKIMRLAFGLVQLLDGFKTTNDNVQGRIPDFISEAGFQNVEVSQSINTAVGTFSYFQSIKK
jgi:ubiquinone/menaquinone biosynthesis C-methylase UbiE